MTHQELLDDEIQDARGLLYHLELALDLGQVSEASYFASELAETLYKARLIDLQIEAENPEAPLFGVPDLADSANLKTAENPCGSTHFADLAG